MLSSLNCTVPYRWYSMTIIAQDYMGKGLDIFSSGLPEAEHRLREDLLAKPVNYYPQ